MPPTKKQNASGISSKYINTILGSKNLPFFIGTYPSDKCPNIKTMRNNFCMIINTDKATKPGEHWIAVLRHNNVIKISDSLLFPLVSPPQNLAYIVKNASYLRTHPIQTIESQNCGFYCVLDILHFHLSIQNKKPKNVPFKKKAANINDEICISNIENMISLLDK